MVLGGIWHGANWTFIIWGMIHGFALIIGHWLHDKLKFKSLFLQKGSNCLGFIFTNLIVLVAWVPFRAESLEGAVNFYTNMLSLNNGYIFSLENTGLLPQELFIFLPIALIIVFFPINSSSIILFGRKNPTFRNLLALFSGFMFMLSVTSLSGADDFVYFQF